MIAVGGPLACVLPCPTHEDTGCVEGACVAAYELPTSETLEYPSQVLEFIDGCDVMARDENDRVTRFKCGDAPESTAAYDEAGRIINATFSGDSEYNFTYDAGGRMLTGSRLDGAASYRNSEFDWSADVVTYEHTTSRSPWRGVDERWRDGDEHVADLVRHWDDAGHILDEENRGGADLFLSRRIEYTWEGERLALVVTITASGGPNNLQGPPSCPTTSGYFTCETTFEYEGETMAAFETAGQKTSVSANCCEVCRAVGDG
jgi:hypothetical protein